MDISTVMGDRELAELKARVETFNKGLRADRPQQKDLAKDDFLKILITQLTHQDPTQPMEDRAFVAQMAQFSTLEQMTNMNAELGHLLQLMARGQALGLLGRSVEIADGAETVRGLVEQVTGGEFPQVLVNGRYYDAAAVQSVSKE